MICPKCQSDNPDEVKFCNKCVTRLEPTCPHCRQANPADSNFCNNCGRKISSADLEPRLEKVQPHAYTPVYLAEKILTTRGSIEGESKQVTVLFCDITRAEGKRLLKLARQTGDRVMEGVALAMMDWTASYTHAFDQALAEAGQAIEIGRETEQNPVMARGHIIEGHVYGVTDRISQSRPELDWALELSCSVNDDINRAAALRITGLAKGWEGENSEGAGHLREGILSALSLIREKGMSSTTSSKVIMDLF